MNKINALIEAGEQAAQRPDDSVVWTTRLAREARNALPEIVELVELCREHFSDPSQRIEHPERKWERENRIREICDE